MLARSLFMLSGILLLLLPSAHAQDDGGKQELQRLQGTWKCVAREGKPFAKPPSGVHLLTITGNQYKVEIKDQPKGEFDLVGWGSDAGTLILDPSQSPKRLDAKGADKDAPPWLAIYRLEGNKLTLLIRTFERPRNFEDKERTTLLIFEAVNKK